MINGGTGIISSNVITDVLTDSSKMILKSDSFPLDPLKSQTLVIASQNELTLSCDKNVRASSEIGNSRIYHGSISTPIMNKNIWSVDDNFRVQSDGREVDKRDTSVQRSLANESNMAYPQIKEESIKIVFSKIVEESNLSERMNLANSAIIEPPKLVSFGHPPMETDNVGNRLGGIVATRIETSDSIWRCTVMDDRIAYMHDNIETIGENKAYRKHIRYL